MKTDEKKERDIELRSEELQEIIGRIPSSIEKYGILVMACIVSVLIIGSFFFCYPDTIDAPIVITNSTPPVNIVSKVNGKIVKIFKANEESVISLETLKTTTSELISTIKEVEKIHADGEHQRELIEKEIRNMSIQLEEAIKRV